MNNHNTTPNYMTSGHIQHASYVPPPPPPLQHSDDDFIDRAYVTSIRGILKFACLVNELNR